MKLYDWQLSLWQQLWRPGIERIPHAILLCGQAGIGKLIFANILAAGLLCQRRPADNLPCGECNACHYFEQNAHPDFRLLTPASEMAIDEIDDKEKKASEYITISQIRELGNFIFLTSHQNGRRVVLVSPAEQLNINAANALLKMLEEPPPQTIFLLVTNQLSRILPTIRSRCRVLQMPAPDSQFASAWLRQQHCSEPALSLALAGNAPLGALKNSEDGEWQTQRKRFCEALSRPTAGDPIALAESVLKLTPAAVLRWLQTWIYDLVHLKTMQKNRYHLDFEKSQNHFNKNVELIELFNFNNEVTAARRLLHHPLNPKLFWESLFIKYFNLHK